MRRAVVRLLGVFHRWAESGWGGSAVGTWGFLQASVMPGPTDAVLIPLGLADPKRAFRLAAFAIAGSVLGGMLAYALGAGALGSLAPRLLELFGMAPGTVEASRGMFEQRGWMLVAASTVTPLSSKMVCLTAGAFGLPFWQFILALGAGRILRNVLIATVLRLAGPAILRRLTARAPMVAAGGGQA